MIKTAKNVFVAIILILSLLLTAGCGSKKEDKEAPHKSSSTKAETESSLSSNTSQYSEDISEGQSNSSYVTDSDSSLLSPEYSLPSSITSSDTASLDSSDTGSDTASVDPSAISIRQKEVYKKAVSVVFDAIKDGDFEKAKENLTGNYPFEDPIGFDARTMERVKKILSELQYEILDLKRVSDSEVTVTVKVKAINFKKVFKSFIKKSKAIANAGSKYTIQEVEIKTEEAFKNLFKKGKKELVETEIKLSVVGHEKNWMLEHSAVFSKACLGGITSVGDIYS